MAIENDCPWGQYFLNCGIYIMTAWPTSCSKWPLGQDWNYWQNTLTHLSSLDCCEFCVIHSAIYMCLAEPLLNFNGGSAKFGLTYLVKWNRPLEFSWNVYDMRYWKFKVTGNFMETRCCHHCCAWWWLNIVSVWCEWMIHQLMKSQFVE